MKARQAVSSSRMLILSISFLIAAILLGIAITFLLARSISRPVQKGLAFSTRIAEGDLTSRIDLTRKTSSASSPTR
jgi:methyl-accepting chemotaxis protein